jgi:hypothetical protein
MESPQIPGRIVLVQDCHRVPQIDHQSMLKLGIAIRKGTKIREHGQGNAQRSTG